MTLLDIRHLDQRLGIDAELASLAAGQELMADNHYWRMYDLLEVGDIESARQQYAQLDELATRSAALPLDRRRRPRAVRGARRQAHRRRELRAGVTAEADSACTLDAKSMWAGQVFRRRLRRGRVGKLTRVVEQLAASGGHTLGWRAGLGVLRFDAGDTDGARRIYGDRPRPRWVRVACSGSPAWRR